METECTEMRKYISLLCTEEYCAATRHGTAAEIWVNIVSAVYKLYDDNFE